MKITTPVSLVRGNLAGIRRRHAPRRRSGSAFLPLLAASALALSFAILGGAAPVAAATVTQSELIAVNSDSSWGMTSNGSNAYNQPSELSSGAFYGSVATLTGDVSGTAGEVDLVAVNSNSTWVMRSVNGGAFTAPTEWSSVPFYGTKATLLADVSGNAAMADLIAVNNNSVWVMPSTGSGFGTPTEWSSTAFYGTITTLAADVTGGAAADLVAVNAGSTWVMTSTGSTFNTPAEWSSSAFYGSHATLAADVNGDGKTDLIAVNSNSSWVMTSTGSAFNAPAEWSSNAFYGTQATLASDVNQDGNADLIAVNSSSTWVMLSNGSSAFGAPTEWSSSAFYGSVVTLATTQTVTVAAPSMQSAVVGSGSIAITYNEAVSCPATGADSDFVYDSSTGTSGGAVTNCATAGDVLTLTGTFTPPTVSGIIVYTAPTTSTTSNAVYATGAPTDFAATQTLAVGPVPAMVSAAVNAATIAITYNESVSCPTTGADSDFVYDSSTGTSGGGVTGCTHSGDVLTLAGTFTLPAGSTGSIVYTAPTTSTTSNAVYATGSTTDFAATQTLASVGVPAMVSAAVSAGTIVITYNESVSCPTTGADSDFVYDSSTGTSGGAVAGCGTTGDVLTLTGTFAPATNTGSIVYTAPTTTNTTSNAVYATGSTTDFAATQTLPARPVPVMVTAIVTATTIAITYNVDVSCNPAGTAYTDFTYDFTTATSGGSITGCTHLNTVLTLAGTFTAPTGTTGSILYTAPTTSTTLNAVYATAVSTDFAATQTLSGAAVT